MHTTYKHKTDFPQKDGKTMLSSYDDIALWINLGFEEQKEDIRLGHKSKTIDLSNCDISPNYNNIEIRGYYPLYFNSLVELVDGVISSEDKSVEVLYDIDFSKSILNGGFISNVKFKGNVLFMGTTFEGSSVSLHKCIFEKWCRFNRSKFPLNVRIEQCQFNSFLDFENVQFSNIVEICHSKFGGDIVLQEISFSTIDFDKNYFCIWNCDFSDKVHTNKNTFDQPLSIRDSTFNGQVEFKETTINKSLDIQQCQINNVMLFSDENNTLNINNIRFWHCVINGEIHFESTNIDDCKIEFSIFAHTGRARFNSCNIANELKLIESTINGRVDITHSVISKIDMEGTIVPGYVNQYKTEVKEVAGRYTARILKDSLYRLNNVIDALHYRSMEILLYQKELKRDIANYKFVKIWDYLLVGLNRCSNNNGLSWSRGLVFTSAAAWLFFIVINYCGVSNARFFEWGWSGWDSFGEVWKHYLNMFYLTDFKAKFDGVKLNALGETLFFISKIFVGYGVYQTISAFRKYGK